ncbi:MAG TPA: family 10 glycosylhydrolase, partial [Candidatus Glassbacteria bacterium]|nr:family 10 glycosylhydrolase [Candidatus Glassbacteria bacterium]
PWTIEWYHAPADTDPDRLVHDTQGQTANTLCPSVEENRVQMRDMLLELVAGYAIDGVQYDYMRFPGAEYCYCRHCREGFEKQLGGPVADWPADVVKGGKLENPYLDYLKGTISSFVEEMYPRIKSIKPQLVVSAAVWCHDSLAGHPGVRQDWGRWVENGWLDYLAPMNYGNKWVTEHFDMFARSEARHVAGKLPLVFGLGAYLDTPEHEVASVKLGRELGGSGFIIYTLTEKIINEHLPVLSREVWREPAVVPAFGRKTN